jgi:cytochrome b subunit of formate dehydrogenase
MQENELNHGDREAGRALPSASIISVSRCLGGECPFLIAVLLFVFSAAPPCFAAEAESAEELPANEDCATCHGSKDLKKKLPDGKEKGLFVDEELFGRSVHSKLQCVDCHAAVRELPHKKDQPIPAASCQKCHAAEVAKHAEGVHGKARSGGNHQAATCVACHGSHGILSAKDPASATHHSQVVKTCGSCHGTLKMAVEEIGAAPQKPFFAYQESVHGKKVVGGSLKAAVCTDCHQSHDILPPNDSRSTIFRFNVPRTCGRCHGEVEARYEESVHGAASRKGITRAPVCTDCHGIHTIKSHLDPESSVSSRAIARTTCPQCHESQSIAREFGLPAGKLQSYLESYHGLAGSRGSTVVANCASCHGIHDIYPSSDARSTIHQANLARTCGKCHPGVGENFIEGKIHGATLEAGQPPEMSAWVLSFTRNFYLTLIFVVVGGMLLHNLLDLRKKSNPHNRYLPEAHLRAERMDMNQRIQHAFLAASFILLVLTGFALRFEGSWLSRLFGDEEVRRIIHRSAATVMLLLGAYHLAYLRAAKGGRQAFRDLLPRLSDLHEAVHTIRWNLGRSPERPEPGRFGYVEKLEYWALMWGTIVMAVTGLSLWFKTTATGLGLPLWTLDLARLIHYYEAWLATLAIIVWHFYFVMFDPAIYPMNWAWLHGRIQKTPRVPESSPAELQAVNPEGDTMR